MALLLEVGLLLILIPWSAFWDHNYFADASPIIREAIRNNYVRGAVSGLGLLNLYVALAELADLFLRRSADEPPQQVMDRHGP